MWIWGTIGNWEAKGTVFFDKPLVAGGPPKSGVLINKAVRPATSAYGTAPRESKLGGALDDKMHKAGFIVRRALDEFTD